MKKFRKILCALCLVGLMACAAGGVAAFASYEQPSAWTAMAGWRDATAIVGYDNDAGKGVNIYQKTGTDFAVCYSEKPFYVDGFELRFFADYGKGNVGNLKIVLNRSAAWWQDDNACFTFDMEYKANNLCSVTQNTKNPNGYSDYATPGGPDAPFYWDGSKENVFRVYFQDDGLLYFSLNGVEMDSSANGLDTARLEKEGILESFVNGKAYLQLWGQMLNAKLVLDVNTAPLEMEEPRFTAFEEDAAWKVTEGKALSFSDGTRVRAFKNADAAPFSLAKKEEMTLKNAYTKFNLALKGDARAELIYAGENGREVRVYASGKEKDNVSLSLFDGAKERVLYAGTHKLSLMDYAAPAYTEAFSVQIKRVGVYYKLLIDGEIADADLGEMTAFVDENFQNERCVFTLRIAGEGVVKTVCVKSLEDASFKNAFANVKGSNAVISADGSDELIYSALDGGPFQVLDASSNFWADAFGMGFRLDKYDQSDTSAFRIVLSSSPAWYRSAGAEAIILSFQKESGKTRASVLRFDGKSEKLLADAENDEFGWVYEKENYVNFGYTNYGWMLKVNGEELTLSANIDGAMNEAKGAFSDRIAYLQLENEGGAGTSVSINRYGYMVEAYIAPEGWQQGHYLVAPEWGEASPDAEASFSLTGENYTAEKSGKVPFDGFRINFALAPGNAQTQISMALSDGSTDWYNTSWSIGVMMTYTGRQMVENDQIQIGLIFANPDEGLESTRVNNITTTFHWYRENTIEIKMYRGAYQLLLNGNDLFTAFDSYVRKIEDAYIDNNAELQYFVMGDATIRVYETTKIERSDPPAVVRSEAAKLSETQYAAGKEIQIDLSKLFRSDSPSLTYTANVGEIEGSVWKYTPAKKGKISLTVVANDGAQNSLPLTIELNVTAGGGCNSAAAVSGTAVFSVLALAAAALLTLPRRKHDEK